MARLRLPKVALYLAGASSLALFSLPSRALESGMTHSSLQLLLLLVAC